MTRKFTSLVLKGFLGALLMTTALSAEEAVEKQHAPVGERAEPMEQQVARLQAQEDLITENKKTDSTKKSKKLKKKNIQISKNLFSTNTFYTTHPGAYQNLASVSFLGDSVELMDGSIWAVSTLDAYKTISWLHSDVIVITQNHSWFSSYFYRLTNQNTGESVAVKMYLGPISPALNGIFTHWIVSVDYYHNTVYLEDGSTWRMSAFDRGAVDKWLVNDIVIIGVNDGWLSSSNPNILINVNMLNHAAGSTIY